MFYILLIICLIESTSNYRLSMNPRSVNLELETSVLIEPKDIVKHKDIIHNLEVMFRHFKQILAPTRFPNFRKSSKKTHLLTKFLKKLGAVLLEYKSKHFKDVLKVLKLELDIYYENGPKHKGIFHDEKFKRFLMSTVKEWTMTKPKILQKQINESYVGNHTIIAGFINYLNQFYKVEDLNKLKEIVKTFEYYPTHGNELKLTEVIMDALDFVIFDRYENLSTALKEELANVINKLMENFDNSNQDKHVDVIVDLNNAIKNNFQSELKTIVFRSEDTTDANIYTVHNKTHAKRKISNVFRSTSDRTTTHMYEEREVSTSTKGSKHHTSPDRKLKRREIENDIVYVGKDTSTGSNFSSSVVTGLFY